MGKKHVYVAMVAFTLAACDAIEDKGAGASGAGGSGAGGSATDAAGGGAAGAGSSQFPEPECQTECGPALRDGLDESNGLYDTVTTSLDCRCGSGGCPASLGEAVEMFCTPEWQGVRRIEGCGLTVIAESDGLTGRHWVFESGEGSDAGSAVSPLVGSLEYSDVPSEPCQTYEWVSGRKFDCEDTVECPACPLASEDVPAGCE